MQISARLRLLVGLKVYRSTSPITKSSEPTIAKRSASITPFDISGRTERLEKLGPLDLHLNGMSDRPSARKKNPSSPLGFSALT